MKGAAGINGQLVVAQGLGKSYPRVRALAPLNLSIQEGERVALAGPSGSGKTTLLYLMAGLVQPDQGHVAIAGRQMTELRPGKELARLVAVMHQGYDLVPQLTVVHNVLAGRLGQWSLFHSLTSLVWPRERYLAEEALSRLGIGDKLHERTSRLSGGEQQRVAIARLMVQSSRVILADEPVSSLDPARAEDMLKLLTGLVDSSDKALVASLHSPELIRKHFSRVIGLRRGVLQFDMPTTELSDEVLERLYLLDSQDNQLDSQSPREAVAEIPR